MADPAAMIEMIESYLLAQGTKTMSECLTVHSNDVELLAALQDKLGRDSFLRRYLSLECWGQQFIGKPLNILQRVSRR